jgi:hypothetical protein
MRQQSGMGREPAVSYSTLVQDGAGDKSFGKHLVWWQCGSGNLPVGPKHDKLLHHGAEEWRSPSRIWPVTSPGLNPRLAKRCEARVPPKNTPPAAHATYPGVMLPAWTTRRQRAISSRWKAVNASG